MAKYLCLQDGYLSPISTMLTAGSTVILNKRMEKEVITSQYPNIRSRSLKKGELEYYAKDATTKQVVRMVGKAGDTVEELCFTKWLKYIDDTPVPEDTLDPVVEMAAPPPPPGARGRTVAPVTAK